MSQRQLTTPSAGTAAGLRSAEAESLILAFDDNRLLSLIFGEHDEHLALIENRLGVDITPRGNRLSLRGTLPARDNARRRC